MAVKFGRTFTLKVTQDKGDPIFFGLPYTLDFSVSRSNRAEANMATFRLRNLALTTRSLLRKDDLDSLNHKSMSLMAGYGTNQQTIFQGQVMKGASWREGTDFITELNGFDGGTALVTKEFSNQYSAGTPIQAIIEDIIKFLIQNGVNRGAVAPITGSIQKGRAYQGAPLPLLLELTGNAAFVDNGLINIIPDNSFIETAVREISSATGLLDTPTIADQYVSTNILFEPSIVMGQIVNLLSSESTQSQFNSPNFNGTYKVIGISHRGVISPTINGQAVTTLSLFNFKPSQGNGLVAVRNG